MIYTYRECKEKYGSAYQIRKAVEDGKIFFLQKGLYSDKEHVSQLALLMAKYPKAVFTMRNAFYYHGLTDVVPDQYDLATERDAAKIRDPSVVQFFYPADFFEQGVTEMQYQGTRIRIYDKERMLIELVRYRTKIPFDYYKELITSYRKMISDLDIEKLENYAACAPYSDKVTDVLQVEVF
jgi:hypothetical protein